jgi:hypothetical protein
VHRWTLGLVGGAYIYLYTPTSTHIFTMADKDKMAKYRTEIQQVSVLLLFVFVQFLAIASSFSVDHLFGPIVIPLIPERDTHLSLVS